MLEWTLDLEVISEDSEEDLEDVTMEDSGEVIVEDLDVAIAGIIDFCLNLDYKNF